MLSNDARTSLGQATDQYVRALSREEGCVRYLAERGIEIDLDIPPEAGNPWSLGYVDRPAMPEHEHMTGRLAIPYVTPRGGVVGMKFRALDDAKPKYLAHRGMGDRMFGVCSLRIESDVIGITEGELDAVVASECGIPTVGIAGANAWRESWGYIFEGYRRVIVFGDGDEAGEEAADRICEELPNARVLMMPPGHDVSSFVVEYGSDELRQKAEV